MAYRITRFGRALLLGSILTLAGCAALPLPVGTLPADPAKAEEAYRQGLAYSRGSGVEQDHARAVRHFKRAARLGSAEAAYLTGMAYLIGRGVDVDDHAAAHWLEQARVLGHPRAYYQLGGLYLAGQGVIEDKAWGAMHLGVAAQAGHGRAMLELAALYFKGIGVPADLGMAWYWSDAAARTGVADGQKARLNLLRLTSAAQRAAARRRVAQAKNAVLDMATTLYVQQQLAALHYEPGLQDGVWGPRTARAMRQFREAEGLPNSEVVTRDNLLRLRRRSSG